MSTPPTPGPQPIGRDTADRLSAAKLWLVSTDSPSTCGNMPYLATALYSLVPVVTDRVSNLTTDRYWRVYLNPTWIAATDIPDVAADLAHAVWHLLADHPARADDMAIRPATADHWRRAADATVAEMLDHAAIPSPVPGPADLGLRPGRSAEEYYAVLSGLPTADDTTHPDTADAPAEETTDGGEREDPTCGSGCDGRPRGYELPTSAPIGAVGEASAEQIRKQVAIEFREHQTRAGTQPGEWDRWVRDILDPVVPWTQVLTAAVRRGVGWAHGHTDYTYTRISRRQTVAGSVILPATRRPVPEIAVVVDTSGSIDDGLLSQALGEVDGVLKGMGVSGRSVTVLATDAAVHAVTRVSSGRDARIGGGGGTDMGVGITAAIDLKPRPTLIIVLTDGFTPWPSVPPPTPVVAVLIGRSTAELPPSPTWAQRVECVPDGRR